MLEIVSSLSVSSEVPTGYPNDTEPSFLCTSDAQFQKFLILTAGNPDKSDSNPDST